MSETGPLSSGSPPMRGLERPGKRATVLLEQCLRNWEDIGLINGVLAKMTMVNATPQIRSIIQHGPLTHWKNIREYLKKASNPKNDIRGIEHFIVTEEDRRTEKNYAHQLMRDAGVYSSGNVTLLSAYDNYFIPQLISWARESRRVFSLSKETTALFKAINYDAFTFDKFLRPFKAFLISLENSDIVYRDDEERSFRLDSILVTDLSALDGSFPPAIQYRLFFSDPARDVGFEAIFTASERKIMERAAEKAGPSVDDEALNISQSKANSNVKSTNSSTAFGFELTSPVSNPDANDLTNDIRKIIAGLCLYLAHAPGKEFGAEDIRGETWHELGEKPKKESKKITPQSLISEEAQVFDVRNIHEFDPKRGRVVYTDKRGEVQEAHSVRAHEKRPKGMGHIPEAEKSVRIESYWRSLGKLSENALPLF